MAYLTEIRPMQLRRFLQTNHDQWQVTTTVERRAKPTQSDQLPPLPTPL
jgi:hypothetical protein